MTFVGELRPYQVPRVEMMVRNKTVLLAADMGTGKTVMSIAAVERLIDMGKVETCFVVAQAGLRGQWFKEIKRFAPDSKVIIVDGQKDKRRRLYKECSTGKYEYIIIGYEQLVNDGDELRTIGFDCVIADEVTMAKSFDAKRANALRTMRCPYRFGLSGQPVENLPEELFGIMLWIDYKVLGNFETFDQCFIERNLRTGRPKRYRNLKLLHKRMRNHMIRMKRDDPDVKPYMPDVEETSIFPEFDSATAKLYRRITKELLQEIDLAMRMHKSFNIMEHYGRAPKTENDTRGRVMSRMLALRMLCDHPELLRQSALRYKQSRIERRIEFGHDGAPTRLVGTARKRTQGSEYAARLYDEGALDGLPTSSQKLTAVVAEINQLLDADPNTKIVVFSGFKGTAQLIADMLPNVGHVIYNGDLSRIQRDAAKERFQTVKSCRLFLSSDAGGYGLDLPQAQYLFNIDLPWSAGKLEQRNARIVRASSTFDKVIVVNVLMAGSIEERQYDMLAEKRAIAAAWVDGKGIKGKKGVLGLSLGTLKEFLEVSLV